MIQIDLKLFVTLSKYHPRGGGAYDVAENTSVAQLIGDLGSPVETVKLVFINGKRALPDQVLLDGDRLGLFPPVGGG